jgi:ABC-type glycerol-3-phosphate transport system substrate-binding protein
MKRSAILLTLLMVGVMLFTSCATPTPQTIIQTVQVEKTVEVVTTVEVVKEVEKEVIKTVEVEKKVTPLFWDSAKNACAKKVKLTINTHGDHQSRNQDALFGVGVLQNQWEQLQPCVQVETIRIPQGTSPSINVERWTAGTNADVVFTWIDAQTAGAENKWVLPLEDYFKQKNPYSDNATWFEDFLFPEVFYIPHTDGHTYVVRPGVRPGSNGLRAWFYNKDLIMASGVPEDKVLPKTWTEWFAIFEKIKAAGKIPIFIPLGGNTAWEWSVWMVWDMADMFSGNLSQEIYGIMTDGTENAQGTISNQKLQRAIIEGKWDLNDPRVWQFFEVSDKLFNYIEPGYAAVPDMVAETPSDFLKGNVGYAFAGVWRVSTVSRYPGLPFTWGTVWYPKPDKEFNEYATDHYAPDTGASPGTAEMVHLGISSTAAKDPDVLAAAVDFAMFVTSPSANKTWCTYQSVPCTEPGTSFDEIVGDNQELRTQLFGFFNPPRDGKVVQTGVMSALVNNITGGSTELDRRFTEYHEKKMSKEEFIKIMMEDIIQNAKTTCKHNLELKVKGWEFCSELKLD